MANHDLHEKNDKKKNSFYISFRLASSWRRVPHMTHTTIANIDTKDTENPTVFIIDDDIGILHALEELVKSVGLNSECYQSSLSFLENYNNHRNGCILSDMRMPNMGGIQLLKELKLLKNTLPIILLTGYGDIESAVHVMKLGAADFICKPFNNSYLLEQIQKAVNSSTHQLNSIEEIHNKRAVDLTKREWEVLNLISKGNLNKQIAAKLFISNSTVEFHRSRIKKKLGAKNIAEIIKIYLSIRHLHNV